MKYLALLFILPLLLACSQEPVIEDQCPLGASILTEYTSTDNEEVRIYSDGNAYFLTDGICELVATYYDVAFYDKTFNQTDTGVYFIVDSDTYLKPFRSGMLDFEGFSDITDLFRLDISQSDLFLTNITLQSPLAPTVAEYINLQNCILSNTCDFVDNYIELDADPTDAANTVLKYYAVSPAEGMVTSKAATTTTLAYFEKGDDFWFEAMYYVEGSNLPTTLADFESSFFLESPGPRVIIRGDQLAIENKFNEKLTFNQQESLAKAFPLNQWVTVKVHLRYHETSGIIQLWQDGELIIDQTGQTMPFDIWIQDRVEFGITANQQECTLYVDEVQFSDVPL